LLFAVSTLIGMPYWFSQLVWSYQDPAPGRRPDSLTMGLTDYGTPQYSYGGELIACGCRFPTLRIAARRI